MTQTIGQTKPEDQFPILRRNTTDGTRVNVIARDGDGNEIGRREYWFDGLDYSVWFENMRQGEDSTYFFDGETGELQLNTESLKDKKNVSVEWEVGYRTDVDENENDQFTWYRPVRSSGPRKKVTTAYL